MKIALWVLAAVLAVICILLWAPVYVRLYFSKEGYVTLRYLFLFHRFTSADKSKPGAHKKSKKQKAEKKPKSKKNAFQTAIDEKGVLAGTRDILRLVRSIIERIFKLMRRAEVTQLHLRLTVSEGDAAATAITYGALCTVFYPLVGAVNTLFKVKKQEISCLADYGDEKRTEVFLDCRFKVRVWHMLAALIAVIKDYTKMKIQTGNQQKGGKSNG